ncbi:MAG: cobalamin-binding protein [Flavobacteriaceae bacterium]|nr:cobalamin-binding protein [Flavobacteriaceae bacterium]
MNNTTDYYPKRIVCLTEETTETLYLLGEQDRIVGISGFTVRPKQARKEKLKVSTFLDANIDEIIKLKPDLVIGFSDIQADIAKQLISVGITVWINNHRSVKGILNMIVQLGALVGKAKEAIEIVNTINTNIDNIAEITNNWKVKPKVYFEEWYDPIITSIQWVSEIVELAGGVDVFPENSKQSLAKNRIVADNQKIVKINPDIIMAAWCGKMFKKQKMLSRDNWDDIEAVKTDSIYEIDSSIILQPGPASLIEGLPLVHKHLANWVSKQV